MAVKTRFAPSPTGMLHIGGARTALFSWLFARHNQGTFVLRIEDTDKVRSKQEYLDEILDSLNWLGLNWDEIYHQSQRFDLYRQYADKLLQEGKAVAKEGAVFLHTEFKEIIIQDIIRGDIIFKELPKKEEVIIKSDGSPTYNFACCIDDALMGVTHVVRGEDHISNTPKQMLMYQALGFKTPCFAHVPLILAQEGNRMSKRFGATAISEYRAKGYLPQALVNYLMLLGWSPGGKKEIISLDDAIQEFDLKDVGKTAARFNKDKLDWINNSYLKEMDTDSLLHQANSVLVKSGLFIPQDKEYFLKVLNLFKERMNTLADLCDWADFCFKEDIVYQPDTETVLSSDRREEVLKLSQVLDGLHVFTRDVIEQSFRRLCRELGIKTKDLIHPVRVALTGKKVGPGLFETMEVLGKERVVSRLRGLIAWWQTKAGPGKDN